MAIKKTKDDSHIFILNVRSGFTGPSDDKPVRGLGIQAVWWSASGYETITHASNLGVAKNTVHPSSAYDRYSGNSLRCLSTV